MITKHLRAVVRVCMRAMFAGDALRLDSNVDGPRSRSTRGRCSAASRRLPQTALAILHFSFSSSSLSALCGVRAIVP